MAKKCGRFSRRFWRPALSGVLGGPIGMSAYLLSIHYLTIYYAAPLSSLFPVFAALMSYWILKEKNYQNSPIRIRLGYYFFFVACY